MSPVTEQIESTKPTEGRLFQKVPDPMSLRPILESRLPRSCCLINQLLVFEKFKDNLKAYTFDESAVTEEENGQNILENKRWVLFTYYREDCNCVITISSPTPDSDALPTEVEHALEFSNVLDYDAPFLFVNMDLNLSDFLQKLNVRKIGNVIKIFPCYLFYMSPQDAAKVEVPTPADPSVTVGPCDVIKTIEFFKNHWDFYRESSKDFFTKCLPHCPSAAVYLGNGEIVCAVLLAPYGNICSLVTRKDQRRKGYASLAMRYLLREAGRQGLHLPWETYITNHAGIPLHLSFNPQILAKVDYICHKTL